MYYLQSRYYDPTVGRFVNADVYSSTGQGIIGHNMFAYCLNSPPSSVDSLGSVTVSAFLGAVVGGAVAGAIISTVSYVASSGINGQSISKEGLISSATSGAISGAIGGAIGTISLGAKAVSVVQQLIPSATEKMLTIAAKGAASLAAGVLLSKGQSQYGIVLASTTTSTFLGSLIDATTNTFLGTAFCNYAATLFIGTAFEVGTVATKQISSASSTKKATSNGLSARRNSGLKRQIPHQAARAMERSMLLY